MTPQKQAAIARARTSLGSGEPPAVATPSQFTPAQQAALTRARSGVGAEDPNREVYRGTLLPFAKQADGDIELAVPGMVNDLIEGVQNPGRILRGEIPADMNSLMEAGRQTTGTIATGGIATPRAIIPAGAAAMNAIGPPARAAGNAIVSTAKAVAAPVLDRMDPNGAVGRTFLRAIREQNPNLAPEEAVTLTERYLKDLAGGTGDSVLADTGESLRKVVRNMNAGSGETAQRARDFVKERRDGEKTVAIDSIRNNVSDKEFYDVRGQTEAAKARAGDLYREAFAANKSVSSPHIDRILRTPAGQDAMSYARERMQNRMSRMAVPDKDLGDQINELVEAGKMDRPIGGVASGLKLETLDLIKQAMGQTEQALKRKVLAGTAKPGELADLGDLRRAFTAELDRLDSTAKAGPNSTKAEGGTYAKARKEFSEDASLQDALDNGRDFAKGDYELVVKEFGNLSPDEQDAFRAGAARHWIDLVRNRTNSPLVPSEITGVLQKESAIRRKMQLIAPTRPQFENLVKDMENMLVKRETGPAIRNVSSTGSILMEEGALARDALDNATQGAGLVKDLATQNLPGALTKAMTWTFSALQRLKLPQEARDKIGRLALSKSPDDQAEAFRLVREQLSKSGEPPTSGTPSVPNAPIIPSGPNSATRLSTVGAAEVPGMRAIDDIIQNKRDVMKAMEHDGLTIDFRYGNDQHGFKKIIDKHGEQAARDVPTVITQGRRVERKGDSQRLEFHLGTKKVVLVPDYFGEPGHWVLTSYDPGK